MKEAIQQREELTNWATHKAIEWQTKTLAAFIANTVESEQGRKQLVEMAGKVSLTNTSDTKKSSTKKNRKRTFKLLDGTEIDIKELKNYSYHEIDHSEEDRETTERIRKENAGKSISELMGSFTRIG